jgi:hypothetical protein
MKARVFFACAAFALLACAPVARAQDTYRPGDRVEARSLMSGQWEKGTIVSIDGTMGDGRVRYMFQADDKTLASAFWGTTAENIRRGPPAAPAIAQRSADPTAAADSRSVPRAPSAAAAAPQPGASCAGGASGSVQITGAVQAPLGQGLFPNGAPFGTPGQTNYLLRNGRNSIVTVAPPGKGSFVGSYNLMVGGTWSTLSTRDLGGGATERTLNWNVPAQANALTINADGSWYRKSGSQRFFGRWIDLGQNVAQLIGYDGDDWTASMQMSGGVCQMEVRGPLGQNEWGRRL